MEDFKKSQIIIPNFGSLKDRLLSKKEEKTKEMLKEWQTMGAWVIR